MAKVKQYRGIGGVYKVGPWYYARWTINGKKHTVPTHCSKREDALAFLAKATHAYTYANRRGMLEHIKTEITLMDKGEDEYQQYVNQIPIKNMIDLCLQKKGYKDGRHSTAESYRQNAGYFVVWMTEKHPYLTHMGAVTEEICKEYSEYISQARGACPHNISVKCLKGIWSCLKSQAHLEGNPWTKIKDIKYETSKKENLTREEFLRLKEVCEKKTINKVLFTLAISTGMRLSDCVCAKWSYISPDGKFYRFTPIKTQKYDHKIQIPISSKLKEVLELIPKTDNDFIFPHLAHMWETRSIKTYIRNIFDEAKIERLNQKGIPVKGWHSLRVYSITTMLESGIPLATVQSIVGHFDSDMTQHYYRMDYDKTYQAINTLTYGQEETVTISKSEYNRLKDIERKYLELTAEK